MITAKEFDQLIKDQAQAIANQAQAIAEGNVTNLWGAVTLLETNAQTLRQWVHSQLEGCPK